MAMKRVCRLLLGSCVSLSLSLMTNLALASFPTPYKGLSEFEAKSFTFDPFIEGEHFAFEVFSNQTNNSGEVSEQAIMDRVLVRGYQGREQILNQDKAVFEFWKNAMGMTPHLQLSLAADLGVAQSFSGLLKPFVPSQWCSVLAAYRHTSVEEVLTKLTLTNQLHTAQTLYQTLHKLEGDLTIYQYYISLLKAVIHHMSQHPLSKNSMEIDHLKSLEARQESDALKLLEQWYEGQHKLLYLMALDQNHPLILVDPYQWGMELFPKWDRDEASLKLQRNSLELSALEALYKEKEANYYGQALGFIHELALSIGLDWIVSERLANKELQIIKLRYQDMKDVLLDELNDVYIRYQMAFDMYNVADRGKKAIAFKLQRAFKDYMSGKTPMIEGFYKDFKLALEHDLRKNESLHFVFKAQTDLDRLLYTHKEQVEKAYEELNR